MLCFPRCDLENVLLGNNFENSDIIDTVSNQYQWSLKILANYLIFTIYEWRMENGEQYIRSYATAMNEECTSLTVNN